MDLYIRLNSENDTVVINGDRFDRSLMSGEQKRALRDDAVKLHRGDRPRNLKRLSQEMT